MNKNKIILLVILLFVICACSRSSYYNLSLSGNSNSYYNWTYDIENENILMIESENYFGEETEDEINGLGGNYDFKIKSLNQGRTKVSFLYKKTWEDKDTLYKYIVEFEVDKNLKIKKIKDSGNYLSLIKFFKYDKEKIGFIGDYNDYKLIFDKEIISVNNDECYLLSVYNYNNVIVDVYAISINNNNLYKMENNKLELIK